jgi:hypothetical protein
LAEWVSVKEALKASGSLTPPWLREDGIRFLLGSGKSPEGPVSGPVVVRT